MNNLLQQAVVGGGASGRFDSAAPAPTAKAISAAEATLAYYEMQGVYVIQFWAETSASHLDDGESNAQRLKALFIGIADENKDGEITADELDLMNEAISTANEYLVYLGISENDANELLVNWDDDTADRVIDLIKESLPDGEEAMHEQATNFVYGGGDAAMFDAAYKTKIVFRNGMKKKIRTRISGSVHLSGKQKMAIRKMQAKSHNPTAQRNRLRTMKKRKSAGM